MQFRQITCSTLAAMALYGIVSVSASAAIINFDQTDTNSSTGTVSYGGNGGALTGTDISFNQVSLNAVNGSVTVPAGHQSVLACQSCALDFHTGNNLAEANGNNTSWTFASGGRATITGTVIDADNTAIASGTLLRGRFTNSADGAPQTVFQTGPSSLIASTHGADSKNPDLLRYFGFSADTSSTFNNTQISLAQASFGDNGSFSGSVTAADFNNNAGTRSVSEPGAFGIFGLGIVMLLSGLSVRRKSDAFQRLCHH